MDKEINMGMIVKQESRLKNTLLFDIAWVQGFPSNVTMNHLRMDPRWIVASSLKAIDWKSKQHPHLGPLQEPRYASKPTIITFFHTTPNILKALKEQLSPMDYVIGHFNRCLGHQEELSLAVFNQTLDEVIQLGLTLMTVFHVSEAYVFNPFPKQELIYLKQHAKIEPMS
jgi:hypothetical protein